MPKAYEAKQYEDAIYIAWEQSGYFDPDNLPGERSETFSIVLPPPNVTGILHMGHAVMLAIEDIMVRFARMRGKKTLWVPGTDHAAIATQTKVEKMLMKEEGMKDPRRELGREAFLKRVEAFATESHNIIVNQAKKIGASMDWSREAFTLDAARNRAVNTAFKMMYDDGLIYRADRIVNWCPRCKSTLADDEVEYKEEKTRFYYFKYGSVVIGTARPETKFADKVIIVHPGDARYKDWVGKEMDVEWIEGKVKAKIVADPATDMELGSGAMTITPAHSFVDFDLAKKYGFEIVKIIDEDGNLTSAAGSFAGQNAHEARERIVEVLQKKGLVDHIDDNYVHNLSVCYRCGTAIEPLPKLQWFVDVNKPFVFRASTHAPIEGIGDGAHMSLKQIMQHVVRTRQVEIIPERFEKTYFHWIDNLRDWCISRQIWYGHRVPAWYCKGGLDGKCLMECRHPIVSYQTPTECPACHSSQIEQDADTLDTWFSSGLWTISTLGWPDQTDDLRVHHPTSVLETGYDILFFWVARMILMTTYAVGEVPFKQVYLHGLVRDEQGRKMSKSLENIIDPLDMIERYGADATRLSLVIGTTPGNDSKLSEEKIAGYRNFTNKLWNIARFVLLSLRGASSAGDEAIPMEIASPTELALNDMILADRWILSRLTTVTKEITKHLDAYEFSQAGEKLRDFTWSEFADWYLEVAKVDGGGLGTGDDGKSGVLRFVLDQLLKLWHPFMPFVTEVIYSVIARSPAKPDNEAIHEEIASATAELWPRNDNLLMIQPWPDAEEIYIDVVAEKIFAQLQELIVAIRNIRSQYRMEPKQFLSVSLVASEEARALFAQNESIVKSLARVDQLLFVEQVPQGDAFARAVVGSTQIAVHLAEIVDTQAEHARRQKEIDETVQYLETLARKLTDEIFLQKAPANVVEAMRQKQQEAKARLSALRQ